MRRSNIVSAKKYRGLRRANDALVPHSPRCAEECDSKGVGKEWRLQRVGSARVVRDQQFLKRWTREIGCVLSGAGDISGRTHAKKLEGGGGTLAGTRVIIVKYSAARRLMQDKYSY